jgi:hypothetical protein
MTADSTIAALPFRVVENGVTDDDVDQLITVSRGRTTPHTPR